MEGFAGSVKAVMRQSASKALSGINGTLAQLISVDNDYSTAVEVALGAAMQNIVVDNEADAKRAINYLKQNNQGRATFLPVSAIKPRYIDEKILMTISDSSTLRQILSIAMQNTKISFQTFWAEL